MYRAEAMYEVSNSDGETEMTRKNFFGETADEAWLGAKGAVHEDYKTYWTYRVPEIVGGYVLTDGCSIIGYINVWEE